MLTWHYVSSTTFDAGVAEADGLYFLSDTKEIYRGSELFSGAFEIVDDADSDFDTALGLITRPAHGKIYLSTTTLAGKVYDGAAWREIIHPVDATVTASGTNPVSGKAVADYVAAEIAKITAGTGFVKSISYTSDTATLAVNGGNGAASIQLAGLGVKLNYDAETGELNLLDVTGAELGTGINLDLERFVSAAAYDAAAHEIILAFTDVTSIDTGASYTYPDTMPTHANGKACRAGGKWYISDGSSWTEIDSGETPLVINVGDLVDTYTATNTDTITMTVSSNAFSASVKLDSTQGENLIKSSTNGLYVAPVDLSEYMALIEGGTEGNLVSVDADGQVQDAGVKAGGATLNAAPNATTLATEAAVAAIRTALTSSIDGKIAKMTGATANNVVVATADGQVSDSGKVIGGATLAGVPNQNTLATEAAVSAAIAAAKTDVLVDSDVKTTLESTDTNATIPSSKAVVDAISWVTTM